MRKARSDFLKPHKMIMTVLPGGPDSSWACMLTFPVPEMGRVEVEGIWVPALKAQ